MFIGPLPFSLRDIPDDGRTGAEIVADLEANDVAVFQKHIFLKDTGPIPPLGTTYRFIAVFSRELPSISRTTAEDMVCAVAQEHGKVRRPTPRSALLLMERMSQEYLYADIVVMNEPVLNDDSGNLVLICLGYEEEDGQSWVGAVDANHDPAHDDEMLLFLLGGDS